MTEIKKTNNPICTIILFISSNNFLLRSAKNIPPEFRLLGREKARKWSVFALYLLNEAKHLVTISHVFDFGTVKGQQAALSTQPFALILKDFNACYFLSSQSKMPEINVNGCGGHPGM
jgi:hypothetical protein